MQQLQAVAGGRLMKRNLQKKKNFYGQAILLVVSIESTVILGGVRYSIQNINLHCVVRNTG